MTEVINSIKNPKIKYIRKLYNNHTRKKEGKFILEGTRLITAAVELKANINMLFITPEFAADNADDKIFTLLSEHKFIYVSEKLMKMISDTVNPEGIIAVTDEPQQNNKEIIQNAPYLLILDRVQDPGNMGTLIRTAAASGFSGVVALKGSVDIYNLKVIRATAGSIFSLPVVQNIDFTELQDYLKENKKNIQLISADIDGKTFYHEANYKPPLWLVIGNEANGVRKELLNFSDLIVKIPLKNNIESLNAAVAGSIVMFNITVENPFPCQEVNGMI